MLSIIFPQICFVGILLEDFWRKLKTDKVKIDIKMRWKENYSGIEKVYKARLVFFFIIIIKN